MAIPIKKKKKTEEKKPQVVFSNATPPQPPTLEQILAKINSMPRVIYPPGESPGELEEGGTSQGQWGNISGEEEAKIVLQVTIKELAKKKFSELAVKPFIEDAAEYMGAEIPDVVIDMVAEATVDGGLEALAGGGLAAILEAAGIGASLAVPFLDPLILAGVIAYETAKDMDEESEKKKKLEERAYNGGIDLNPDGTYASKNMPTKGRLGAQWVRSKKSIGGMKMIGGKYQYVDPLDGYAMQAGNVVPLWEQVDKPYFSMLPMSEGIQHFYAVEADREAQEKKRKEAYALYVKVRPKILEEHAKKSRGEDVFDPSKLDLGIFDPSKTEPFFIPPSTDRLVNSNPASNYRPSYNFSKPLVESKGRYEEMLQAGYVDENNPETYMLNPEYGGAYGLYNPHPKWKLAEQPNGGGWGTNWQPPTQTATQPVNVTPGKKTKAHTNSKPVVPSLTPVNSTPPDNSFKGINDMIGLGFMNDANTSLKAPTASTSSGNLSPAYFNMANHSFPLGQVDMSAPAGSVEMGSTPWPAVNAAISKSDQGKGNVHHQGASSHAILPKHHIKGHHHNTYNITVKEVVGHKIHKQHVNGTQANNKAMGEHVAKVLRSVVTASQLHTHD